MSRVATSAFDFVQALARRSRHDRRVPVPTESALIDMYLRYLSDRGCVGVRIPKQTTKTPDLEFVKGKRRFLNEFKSPELHLDPASGMYLYRTTNYKLLSFIHRAIKQLRTYDEGHQRPWITTFASCHMQLNWSNFRDALQGGMEMPGGGSAPPGFVESSAFKRWMHERYEIDLYIWLQVSAEAINPYQAALIVNGRSSFRDDVEFVASELAALPLSTSDVFFTLV